MTVSCNNPPNGSAGIAYSHFFLGSDGVEPFAWAISAGELPDGLTLDAATGEVSGIPTAKGTFDFTVEATDDDAQVGTADCSIRIVGACLLPGNPTPEPFE